VIHGILLLSWRRQISDDIKLPAIPMDCLDHHLRPIETTGCPEQAFSQTNVFEKIIFVAPRKGTVIAGQIYMQPFLIYVVAMVPIIIFYITDSVQTVAPAFDVTAVFPPVRQNTSVDLIFVTGRWRRGRAGRQRFNVPFSG
jgi:hypothetical protein